MICWNVQGLNNLAKRKAVQEFVATTHANLVCFQETKLDVIDQFLVMQCLGPSFDGFAYLPADEIRGGTLIAWDSSMISVDMIQLNANFITGLVHTKVGEPWWITVVYGPQGDDLKTLFLEELRNKRTTCPGPWMLLGDFNMILRASEKSNNNLNRSMMNKFCQFIDELELKEMYMHGRTFTWSNEREETTFTKIDRVLISVDWELDKLDYLLQVLSTGVSDHAPLHLCTSVGFCPKRRFRFELFWTKLDRFDEAV